MVAVEVLQLQIVALANARLQVTRRLDQIALRVIIQNLQFLYNLLLVLYHLVLLVNFCLEPPDLYLLFICLKLYQPVQISYVALPDVDLVFLGVDDGPDAVNLSVEQLLLSLVVAERGHETVDGLLPRAFQVRDDLLGHARPVSQHAQICRNPLHVLKHVRGVLLEEFFSFYDQRLLFTHFLRSSLVVGDTVSPLIDDAVPVESLHVSVLNLLLALFVPRLEQPVLALELRVLPQQPPYELLYRVPYHRRLRLHREVLALNVTQQLRARRTRR